MTDETATKLARHLQGANEELARAVQLVKDQCSPEEFEVWRERIAAVLGMLVLEALAPLYQDRPSLAPDSLRAQYPLTRSK